MREWCAPRSAMPLREARLCRNSFEEYLALLSEPLDVAAPPVLRLLRVPLGTGPLKHVGVISPGNTGEATRSTRLQCTGYLPGVEVPNPCRICDTPSVPTAIETLEQRLGKRWNAIAEARVTTDALVSQLVEAVGDLGDPNIAVVTTGSLGRGEATRDSDADWVLLVDGLSNPDHALLIREIGDRIRAILPKDVGPTGTFGDIVVSHQLVHYIAGTRDTNENLTRRILLLSESRALSNPIVRERVIRNVLARYVVHDRSVASRSSKRQTIPHFLLNDVVRYWRTIASDYASKMWERHRREWGIRNIKLRFSRKLLFIWGLLAAFSGELFATESLRSVEKDDEYFVLLADLIREQTEVTPLELLARVSLDVTPEIGDAIFSSYDEFLAALADPIARKRLESVKFEDAPNDPTYDALRQSSQRFREAVNQLFFDKHPKLPSLIRQFGVF
jgi:hypothetical protein